MASVTLTSSISMVSWPLVRPRHKEPTQQPACSRVPTPNTRHPVTISHQQQLYTKLVIYLSIQHHKYIHQHHTNQVPVREWEWVYPPVNIVSVELIVQIATTEEVHRNPVHQFYHQRVIGRTMARSLILVLPLRHHFEILNSFVGECEKIDLFYVVEFLFQFKTRVFVPINVSTKRKSLGRRVLLL